MNLPPNHHADARPLTGPIGYLAGLTLLFGRSREAQLVADLAKLRPDDRVVDLGCGPGTAVREAARRAHSATGVDPAGPMLAMARRLTGQSLRRRIDWVEASVEDLPLESDSATACWSIAAVHHWQSLDAGVAEVTRILRPGGRFVAAEKLTSPGATGHASHGWTDDQAAQFAALLTDHGFTGIEIRRHPMGRRRAITVLGRAGSPGDTDERDH